MWSDQHAKDLTSLPTVSPSLKILSSFCFNYFHMFLKMGNVQSSLQHLLLFQKNLQHHKEILYFLTIMWLTAWKGFYVERAYGQSAVSKQGATKYKKTPCTAAFKSLPDFGPVYTTFLELIVKQCTQTIHCGTYAKPVGGGNEPGTRTLWTTFFLWLIKKHVIRKVNIFQNKHTVPLWICAILGRPHWLFCDRLFPFHTLTHHDYVEERHYTEYFNGKNHF